MMKEISKTIFYERHLALKANMVEFGGWSMPLHYAGGIIEEHLAVRKNAGLFDVSHMGRFVFRGKGALRFLQHVLTNNAEALNVCQSQYTIIPNAQGGAIDDAYLYRFFKDEYILVVNAANRQKDWDHFEKVIKGFRDVEMLDKTEELVMLSLQGPLSKSILNSIITVGSLPEPLRNELSIAQIKGIETLIARTGYTGEPLCFELFIKSNDALKVWDILIEKGAIPVGLGARDTLRLEAGLPLYGHELNLDINPLEAGLEKYVCFGKENFIGKEALANIKKEGLSRKLMYILMIDQAIPRYGYSIKSGEDVIGAITSGSYAPTLKKGIALGYIDIEQAQIGRDIYIEIRNKPYRAKIVKWPFYRKGTICIQKN